MTALVHNAAVYGIPVDTGRLYDGEDLGYELFVEMVVEAVRETHEAMRRQQGS